MKNLIIIGASAMGRETCGYARDCGMVVKGFLDSRSNILDGLLGYAPVLGSVEEYIPENDDVFICAVGDPLEKRKYVRLLESRGAKFVSVVHPTAYIGANVKLGAGCIVAPNASITNDSVVGDHVIVNINASVCHDNIVGDFTTICPGCCLSGWVKIGKSVFVGAGAVIIPDVSLGDSVFVAAGAVVTHAFPEKVMVAGVPAECKKKLV